MPRHKISLATRNYIYHILFECITRISLFFDIFLISGTRHICEKQKNTKRQSFQKKKNKLKLLLFNALRCSCGVLYYTVIFSAKTAHHHHFAFFSFIFCVSLMECDTHPELSNELLSSKCVCQSQSRNQKINK